MTDIRQASTVPQNILRLLIGLMIISTILFVVGLTLERAGEAGEGAGAHNEAEEPQQSENAEAREEGEEAEEHEENSEAGQAGEASGVVEEAHSETILGIDLESPTLVMAAVVVWLILTVALWRFGSRLLIPIIIVALATALFDGLEVVTQINRGNIGLAALAALITILHIAVAYLACRVLVPQLPMQRATKGL